MVEGDDFKKHIFLFSPIWRKKIDDCDLTFEDSSLVNLMTVLIGMKYICLQKKAQIFKSTNTSFNVPKKASIIYCPDLKAYKESQAEEAAKKEQQRKEREVRTEKKRELYKAEKEKYVHYCCSA